jgi:hypothetical protein
MEPWIPAFAGMTVGGGAAAWEIAARRDRALDPCVRGDDGRLGCSDGEIAARRDEALDPRLRGDDGRWGRGGVGGGGSMRHAQRDSETRAQRA